MTQVTRLRMISTKLPDPNWSRLDLACELDQIVEDIVEIERQRAFWDKEGLVALGFAFGIATMFLIAWNAERIARWVI